MPRKILGVIPARFASSRFPGKVLARIASKTMLQHVYERASMATYLTSTMIATDDQRVYDAARSFGARVRMTRHDHLSGTDRVAEVASAENAEIIVNIQGDEPLIDPAAIDAVILPMVHEPGVVMATLKKRIEDAREITDPNVVKVVTNLQGDAVYFSRCSIPFHRDGAGGAGGPEGSLPACFKHIVYMSISGISCWGIRRFRSVRWNRRSVWSSCARLRTVIQSGWWKLSMNRWAWIVPKIWRGCPGCSRLPFSFNSTLQAGFN